MRETKYCCCVIRGGRGHTVLAKPSGHTSCYNRHVCVCVYSFPHSKPKLLQTWIKNVQKKNWYPSQSSLLCSDHFLPKMLNRTGQKVQLRSGAVPTVFICSTISHCCTDVNELTKNHAVCKDHSYCKTSDSDSPDKATANAEANTDTETAVQQTSDTSANSSTDTNTITHPTACDHHYFIRHSPRFLKRKLEKSHALSVMLRKRRKILQQRIRRLKKKVTSLSEITETLKENHMISENGADVLTGGFSDIPKEVVTRMLRDKKKGHLQRTKYPPALRKFALTLNFYSPKAYRYVRDTFELALPHPSVLQSWYRSVDGEPGFTSEALDVLKQHVKRAKSNDKEVLCNLTLDEMSIRKHIEWDGARFRGYVDIGTETDDDTLPAATEALVFMLVALDASWKLPIAYFLITGMTGTERANLVLECLRKLHTIGVRVTSVTCDGASSNQNMFLQLGASLSREKIQPWFQHPSDPRCHVYIILDVCHMLKLIRNTFASQTLVDNNGKQIKWQYVESLNELQQTNGLRAGNKLRTSHMQWQKQKMKVNLAAQVLSTSVADSLQFCLEENIDGFQDCEATIEFIRTIDHLFDILNSRNPLGKYSKAPLRLSNKSIWFPFLTQAKTYLLTVTNTSGTLMTATNRKTAFLGFAVAIDAVIGLFHDLVMPTVNPPLQYLLTYKLSQDHLELFFGCIRLRGGCNNNPTATQFVAAYKHLLVHHEVKVTNGNCQTLDHITILSANTLWNEKVTHQQDSAHTIAKNMITYDLIPITATDINFDEIPDPIQLSRYVENAVAYIAGYVTRNLLKHLSCRICAVALTKEDTKCDRNQCHLIHVKDRGGLITPSTTTVAVCAEAERCFQRLKVSQPPSCPNFAETVMLCVTENVMTRQQAVFPQLHNHMFDTEPENNHVIHLVKAVAQEYIKIRLYHWGKEYSNQITGPKVRKSLSKLILFRHQ